MNHGRICPVKESINFYGLVTINLYKGRTLGSNIQLSQIDFLPNIELSAKYCEVFSFTFCVALKVCMKAHLGYGDYILGYL